MYRTLITRKYGMYYWHVLPANLAKAQPPFGVEPSLGGAQKAADLYIQGTSTAY